MPTKQRSLVWSGWIVFAALMLMIIGVVNVLEGIVAIMFSRRTVVVADRLYVINPTGWGILVLAFGVILLCAGLGVLSARTWARVVAVVVVALHAVVQVDWLAAYPLWSLLMLALDIIVLYALTAGWRDVTAAPGELVSTTRGRHDSRDQRGTWEHTHTNA